MSLTLHLHMENVIHHSCLQAFSTIRRLFLWGPKSLLLLWATNKPLPSGFLPTPKIFTLNHRPECWRPSLVLMQGTMPLPPAELGSLFSFPLANHWGDILALQWCSFSFLSIYLLSGIGQECHSHHRYSREVDEGGILGVSSAELLSTWISERSTLLG